MGEINPEIVERAARAACLAAGRDPDRLTPAPRGTVGERAVWQLWAPAAQSAIAAVAEELRAEGRNAALEECRQMTDGAGYERGIREAAEMCLQVSLEFEDPRYGGEPLSTFAERFACRQVHARILALLEQPAEAATMHAKPASMHATEPPLPPSEDPRVPALMHAVRGILCNSLFEWEGAGCLLDALAEAEEARRG